MKKKICLILALVWMAVIFYMSNQPASISSAQSGGVITMLKELPFIGSIVSYMMEIDIAEFVIRKSAHMFSFMLLSILWFLSIYDGKNLRKACMMAFIITFLYACTDEFHQLFIEGRSGEFRDILVDSSGALIGMLGIYIRNFITQKSNIIER